MKSIQILCIALLLTGTAQAELYRSIDSSGKVHYSDRPLADADDVEELKVDKEPIPDESLPYETRRAKEYFPVTLYVSKNCGAVCDNARELLNKRGIPFTENMPATQEELDEYRKASGGGSEIPALTVGKTWLKGFLAEQWDKELDFAGYPKTAPYRAKPAPAAATPAQ
ncbi:MAG TPA: glutaredoxin family protein [Sideroxyarcus sp.]|nr:glutaredoxin family protein [Sideroxyarcus sp.]